MKSDAHDDLDDENHGDEPVNGATVEPTGSRRSWT
jgi:hypothetical protein